VRDHAGELAHPRMSPSPAVKGHTRGDRGPDAHRAHLQHGRAH
jgi:hypothetical protein